MQRLVQSIPFPEVNEIPFPTYDYHHLLPARTETVQTTYDHHRIQGAQLHFGDFTIGMYSFRHREILRGVQNGYCVDNGRHFRITTR
jgi:hypothetical protein